MVFLACTSSDSSCGRDLRHLWLHAVVHDQLCVEPWPLLCGCLSGRVDMHLQQAMTGLCRCARRLCSTQGPLTCSQDAAAASCSGCATATGGSFGRQFKHQLPATSGAWPSWYLCPPEALCIVAHRASSRLGCYARGCHRRMCDKMLTNAGGTNAKGVLHELAVPGTDAGIGAPAAVRPCACLQVLSIWFHCTSM